MSKMNIKGLMAKACAAAVVAAAFSIVAPAAMAQDASAPAVQKTPAPKILVIDRSIILRSSKVGQDIVRQAKDYSDAFEKETASERKSLENERDELQKQIAILSPSARDQKTKAFEKKVQAYQAEAQERQEEIQRGVMQAQREVSKAMDPILRGILAERDANLLIDRSAMVMGTVDVDVTALAVDRLNKKMTTVKVDLIKPPKNDNGDGSDQQ